MAAPTKQTTERGDKTQEPPASGPTGPSSGDEGYDAKASTPGQRNHGSDQTPHDQTANNKKGGYGAG